MTKEEMLRSCYRILKYDPNNQDVKNMINILERIDDMSHEVKIIIGSKKLGDDLS